MANDERRVGCRIIDSKLESETSERFLKFEIFFQSYSFIISSLANVSVYELSKFKQKILQVSL